MTACGVTITEGAGLVVIRLTRVGKKKQAHYRIVVADSHRAVQGKFISILGWYNPHTKELQVKKDELQAWFDKGAKPSNTLAKLLKKEGIKLPKWVKITEKKKAPKKQEEEKKEAPSGSAEASTDKKAEAKPKESDSVEAPSEEAAEAPTESDVAEAMPDKEVKEEKAEEAPVEEKAEEPAEEEEPKEK